MPTSAEMTLFDADLMLAGRRRTPAVEVALEDDSAPLGDQETVEPGSSPAAFTAGSSWICALPGAGASARPMTRQQTNAGCFIRTKKQEVSSSGEI